MNTITIHPFRTVLRTLAVLAVTLVLGACGGGAETTSKSAPTNTAVVSNYTGPAPATADVQSFKLNVWDKLTSPTVHCNNCHVAGGQSPAFARSDDINLAYSEAYPVVDLASPANSAMVTRVGGGHNCWLGDTPADWQACADTLVSYITAWAGGASGGGNVIALTAPATLVDPGDTKSFPTDSGLFASTVHPVLTAHCSGCHTESSSTPQSPFFADPDPDSAYEYAKSKIDLDTPANSRFVVRLRNEFHNCFDPNNTGNTDCAASATVMQNAIQQFADGINVTPINPALVTSKAMKLPDGIIASGGNRYDANVIALYQFKEGSGTIAHDTSGVLPDMHLTLSGGVSWVGGWGLDFTGGKAQATTASSRKLHDMIKATGEYSIEAWVVPANVTQEGPARIISYSAGTDARNFTMGQTMYSYDFLQRSSTTDANGMPELQTAAGDEDLQATLQHVVLTYDPVNGRRVYVNGQYTGDMDPVAGGNLNDWDNSFAFVLGNEVSGDKPWLGKLRMVAIHNRALTPEQIQQNFEAGVGEKYFVLFNVAAHTGIPDSYVLFEVSQFDNYSYLFNQPRFIVLDASVTPDNIPIAGIRIGVNGKEAAVGQAYQNVNTTVSATQYTPGSGQLLSPLGTVIALDKGPESDEFFLSFEVLGSDTHIVTEPAPLAPAAPADLPPASDIGVRTFDEIDASMSTITGVSRQQSGVKNVFTTVRQQLPAVENLDGFLSAHQMAISQMAIEYCSALVDNQGSITRDAYFPGFFSAGMSPASADTAFDSAAKRALVTQPLIDHVMNTGLTTQPDPAAVGAELDSLITGLTACASGASPTCATSLRTEQVVKATCAAALGSAAMLIQ
jgi:mono/diheme cytochrome c family protein